MPLPLEVVVPRLLEVVVPMLLEVVVPLLLEGGVLAVFGGRVPVGPVEAAHAGRAAPSAARVGVDGAGRRIADAARPACLALRD